MGFDIRDLHIDENSPEGRALGEIVTREGVTPEEAVRVGLRRSQTVSGDAPKSNGTIESNELAAHGETSARDLFGLFSSPEDLEIFEEAMSYVRESREDEIRRMRESRF